MKKKKEKTIPTIVKRYDYPHGIPEKKEDGTMILEAFTLHPPDKEMPPEDLKKYSAYITEVELFDSLEPKGKFEDYMALKSRGGQFEKTKNPVYSIEAFLIAHENGIYPPMWVLNFIADKLREFHKVMGKKSLDAVFGFKKGRGQKGKGATPLFKKLCEDERDEILHLHVFRLTLLGYTIEDASEMVARKLEETKGWDKTELKLKSLKGSVIGDRYKKKWTKIYNDKTFKEASKKWLTDHKDEFLKSFPEDCLTYYTPKKQKQI